MPRRRLLIGAVAAAALAVLAVWVVAFSPVLGARTVRVQGASGAAAEQVRQAARIADGTPLVRLDRAAVTRRVERLPGVAHASVRTSFPSTVIIVVQERTPVGYVQESGSYRLVDDSGVEYRSVPVRPVHLPRLVVPTGPAAAATVAAVASVAAALPGNLLAQVSSIQALDPDAITVLLSDRRVIRWGSAQRTADKARILPTLLHTAATQIDVSDPDLPFTR